MDMLQGMADLFLREVKKAAHTQRRHSVGHIETSRDPYLDIGLETPLDRELKPHGPRVRHIADILGHKVRILLQAVGIQRAVRILCHFVKMGVVQIPDPDPALSEDLGFAGQILCKIRVLILSDMVRGDVGKDPEVEEDPVRPVQLKGLGGDLHHHILAPGLHHPVKILVELVGFRCGVHRRLLHTCKIDPVGPHHPHLFPAGLQYGLDHVGGGGLPLGAGHPDRHHLPVRIAETGSREIGQGLTAIFHLDDDRIFRELHRMLYHEHPPPRLIDLGAEAVGIRPRPPHTHKHRPRASLPGVVDDLLHLHLQAPLHYLIADLPQPVLYPHTISRLLSFSCSHAVSFTHKCLLSYSFQPADKVAEGGACHKRNPLENVGA